MADINLQRPGKDPLLEMDFLVEIEGIADVGFRDWSDIKHQYAEAKYREGDGPNYDYKQDGKGSVENVTLTRGIFKDDTVIQAWYKSRGRKTVDIVRLKHDRDGDRRSGTYRLYEARCISLSMGKGDAMSEDSNSIMEMVISYEDVDFTAV